MNLNSHNAGRGNLMPPISPEMLVFLQWWHQARNGNDIPIRADLRIDRIAKLISRLLMIDVLSPDEMIIRLTGTNIDAQAGINSTGTNILDITPPEYRDQRSHRLWQMASRPCPGIFFYRNDLEWVDGTVSVGLTLPVRSGADATGRQFISYFDNYRPSIDRNEPGSPVTQNMPDRFAYVDVGFGVPEDGSGEGVTLKELLQQA